MQQPMPNPEDITDPITAMNVALVLMAKAFKLNYSTPTNNNQRMIINPRIQLPQRMNMSQDRHMQMVGGNGGNQFRQYVGQNAGNRNGYNAVQIIGNQVIQNAVQNPESESEWEWDLGELEEVNQTAFDGLNLRIQTSTSGNTDCNAPVYTRRSAEYTISDNMVYNNDIFNMFTQEGHVEQGGGIVEQHPATVEETRQNRFTTPTENALVIRMLVYSQATQQKATALYNGKVLLEKHDPPAVYDSKKTLQLAQESHLKMKQLNKEIKPANYTKINHLSRSANFKIRLLKEAAKFVRDFKSLAKEDDESLAKQKLWNLKLTSLENSFDIEDMMFSCKIERLQVQLGDLKGKSIATACYTQNRSIIHRRFDKTPYELINCRKSDISFLHVFEALCYPKNDHEDIGKLGAKGDIGFFIGYSATSYAYKVCNRRTKKIMETMNVTFDELSAMAFEQSSLKPGLQSMTSGQISSGLDLTYASKTITTQQPTKRELDLLFEAMYDDYIGGQPSAAPRTISAAQEH
ncbi:retrovirus-related pol polyprotein from transposon TNT 1-94 [Tanacetum coccineum]